MLAIEWKKSARADVTDILQYIYDRSPQGADDLYERIEESLSLAATHPLMFKASERMDGMREIVVYSNYLVFYQVKENTLEVTGVIHASRDYP